MVAMSQLFSAPGLTLAATIQSLLAMKLLPDYYSIQNRYAFVFLIFLGNYVFGLFVRVVLYPRLFSPLRHIPGPKSWISPVHRSLMVKEGPSGDLFVGIAKQYPDQELISVSALGDELLVTSPRLFADLLVHKCYDFAKPPKISSFLRQILGDGLIIVEGDQHKFLRKNSMPAFAFRHIKDLYPMIWNKAEALTSTLQRSVDTGAPVIELSSWASKVTLDIIGIAGLGRKFNVVEKQSDPLQDVYEELLEPSREKIIFSMLSLALGPSVVKLLPWKMNGLFAYLTGSLDSICASMIQSKRQAIIEKGDNHFDILSLLIKSNNFSDEALKDQLLTFLAAGHETTASALTWSCYLLAKYPEIQEKLRQEVAEGLSSSDQMSDLANVLEQLPYLNGIIQETLRLFPTVPLTMRQALRDSEIGGQFIPKGTKMIVPIWMINRSPSIWGPDAAEFRPERWITDDGKPKQNAGTGSNYDFLTFLHGPRSCIGQGFAKAEMRCLLAAMVKAFSWDLAMDDSKVVPRGVITIKPESGMYLRLRRQE